MLVSGRDLKTSSSVLLHILCDGRGGLEFVRSVPVMARLATLFRDRLTVTGLPSQQVKLVSTKKRKL